jgi:hypothetical protein
VPPGLLPGQMKLIFPIIIPVLHETSFNTLLGRVFIFSLDVRFCGQDKPEHAIIWTHDNAAAS